MTRTPSARRRRWPRVVALAAGLALLALIVLGATTAFAARRAVRSLRAAQTGLETGGADLLSGDLDGAAAAFGDADRAATDARSALDGFGIGVAGALPWFDQDLDAARAVAEAASLAAVGGADYVEAAVLADWDGETVPGFAPGGRVDAAVLRAMAPGLASAADLLGAAEARLAAIDPTTLSAPLRDPVSSAQTEIATRASQARTAASLAEVLPGMLGADGERTWLLVTLTPSDPRASGGYPGVYGLLRTDGSRIVLTELAPTSDIPQVPPVPPPTPDALRWASRGALTTFWATTYTPDFPTAAQLMVEIWEAGGGTPVDGVIAGDPALMSALLGVVGPVDTPVWPETIISENVEQIVGAETYLTTSQERSDAWQVGIGTSLWDAVLTRPWPIEPMGQAVSGAVDGRHLQVWSADPAEQAAMVDLDAAGEVVFPTDGSPLVTLNGFTANRAGYFVTMTTEVTEGDDGLVTATVTLDSRAPKRPRSILLGIAPRDTGGYPIGSFGGEVNFYLPEGARFVEMEVDAEPVLPFEDREFDRDVVAWRPITEPGASTQLVISYRFAS